MTNEESAVMGRDRIIELLIINTRALFNALLVANRVPVQEALFQLLIYPRPGDMVLDVTTQAFDHGKIGLLKKVVQEPDSTHYYLEDIDGNEQQWGNNCQFIRVFDAYCKPIAEARARGLYHFDA